MNTTKNFIVINEAFLCMGCGADVPPARATCRNHCTVCLASRHVDGPVPGDRAATCGALMDAIAIEGVDPDHLDIVHRCTRCQHTRRNKVASDDNRSAIFALLERNQKTQRMS